MDNTFSELTYNKIFEYFREISSIPRGTGNEEGISNYLLNFAKKHKLEVVQDESLNIIIKKEGTKGYDSRKSIILQGHMDMVCEKNKDINHDFLKDTVELIVEGDYIRGNGTTLGADNGIAIAYFLSILESEDIEHPPLEVVITTGEENGMQGAAKLNGQNLLGKILINIDSEEEGNLLVSCAGGVRNRIGLTVELENRKEGFKPYKISVSGLKGGHSGMDIEKGRGNANKLMGRILFGINKKMDMFISKISGGLKTNAIPREGETIIFIKEDNEKKLKKIVNYYNEVFTKELSIADTNITVKLENVEEKVLRIFSKELTNKIITILMLMPESIQSMSKNIEGLVESSINLGVVKTREDEVIFESAIRSSVKTLKECIVDKIDTLCSSVGAAITLYSDYPAWEYKENSYIRDLCIGVYEEMYKKIPKITAVHAGVECGILKDIIGGIDMISFGPNIYNVHTPNEKVSISSVERTYEYLLNILKIIK